MYYTGEPKTMESLGLNLSSYICMNEIQMYRDTKLYENTRQMKRCFGNKFVNMYHHASVYAINCYGNKLRYKMYIEISKTILSIYSMDSIQ